MATQRAANKNLAEILLEEGRHAPKDSILAQLVNPLQEIARIVRKPVSLLPSAQDVMDYMKKNFGEEVQDAMAGILQRMVDEGEITGQIWIAMIHALRRSTDRDVLTRDARHAGLKKLLFTDELGLQRYELYIPVLLLVADERPVLEDGKPVLDEKSGKPKRERYYVLPSKMVLSDLAKKGTRLPVWRPSERLKQDVTVNGQKTSSWVKTDAFANGLPKEDRVPPVQVTLAREDARKIGAETTCVFYMLWSELIRIAPTLALNKRWEEGLPDKIRNHTFSMAEDVEKMVPDTGPGLGYVNQTQIAFKFVGMQMTAIMRSGGLSPTIPAKRQLMNPRHFSFIFQQARTYEFYGQNGEPIAFSNGRNRCYLHCLDKRQGVWLLVSPLKHPFKEEPTRVRDAWHPDIQALNPSGTLKEPTPYRSMIVDSRLGLLRSCIEFIWVMGWGEPGAQKDLDAIVEFKRAVLDGMRDLASQIEDWRIDMAARRPGVKAEEEKKDTDAAYDQTGKTKNWCHRPFWLRCYRARLDRISVRREKELEAMATADTLTINVVDEEFNKGFLWRHLTDEERRARFVRIYRLAYEVVEREKIRPAIDREGFGRKQAEDLIGKDLYEHVPPAEKATARGQLLAKGDVGDLGPYMDQTLHVNARVAKSFGLVDKGFACYPTAWMTRPVQDWLRHLIMAIGWYDFVEMDQIVGPFAKSYGVAWDVDGKLTHRKAMVLSAIEGKGGAVDQVDTIAEALGAEARNELGHATQDGREKKARAERWWREKAWSRWLLMDLIFAQFGVKAGLADRWRRIMRVDDPVMANDVEKGIARYSQRNLLGKRREPEANPDYDPDFDVAAVAAKIDKRFEEWGIK